MRQGLKSLEKIVAWRFDNWGDMKNTQPVHLTSTDLGVFVKIGMKVAVEWTPIADGWVLPNFRAL